MISRRYGFSVSTPESETNTPFLETKAVGAVAQPDIDVKKHIFFSTTRSEFLESHRPSTSEWPVPWAGPYKVNSSYPYFERMAWYPSNMSPARFSGSYRGMRVGGGLEGCFHELFAGPGTLPNAKGGHMLPQYPCTSPQK
jgi:hypothetical protein